MVQERSSPIVRSYPGTGTGETIYVTADGTRWHHDITRAPTRDTSGTATGNRLGYFRDGSIVDL